MSSKIAQRLKQAEILCQSVGARFTPLRKSVLALMYIHEEHLTAYELLHLLREQNPKIEAMTIYRALDFLQQQKLIHRIASQNAYTTCHTPHHSNHTYFLLCERCRQTQEVNAKPLEKMIMEISKEYEFLLSNKPIEVIGICKNCQIKDK